MVASKGIKPAFAGIWSGTLHGFRSAGLQSFDFPARHTRQAGVARTQRGDHRQTDLPTGHKPDKSQKSRVLCGLRLGTALHYLADAFTHPHHACFTGSLSDHIAYEASLHRAFISYLADGCHPWPWAHIPDFGTYFADMLRLYARARKSEQTDCRFITLMCSMVFESVLHPVRKEKEGPLENPDYNRFIPAGRQRSRDLGAFAGSRIGGARP